MSQQSTSQRRRPAGTRKSRRKAQLAQEQKLVFAAIFLISLIVISPFLIRGLVKQNQQKKLALAQQASVTVQSGKRAAVNSTAAVLPSTTSPAQKNFFQNTLFIGDSRTVGLKEYGGIDGATFLCDVGLDSAKAMTGSLPSLLANHKYSKIYIMLGINEIGNPRQTVLKHYRTLVQYVKNHASGARVTLMGNLHVTAQKASSDAFFSNSNIDSLNQQIAQIARVYGCRYLDPNPPFDDGTGALPEQYSGDGAHLYGKYYTLWKNWIAAQG